MSQDGQTTTQLDPHCSCGLGVENFEAARSGAASCLPADHPSRTSREPPTNPEACAQLSSSLDALETSAESLPNQSRYQQHRHRHGMEARAAAHWALTSTGQSEDARRASRIAGCLQWPSIAQTEDGQLLLVGRRCRDRLCPHCNALRADAASEKMQLTMSRMNSPRMLTLTLKSSPSNLKTQRERLFECFKTLRKTKAWQRHVFGGIFTFEVTRNPKTGHWHPHIHAVIDGEFWHQKALAAEWERVTGDSSIIDIRMVKGRKEAARYVTKYIAKPGEFEQWPDHSIVEYSRSMVGARTYGTFGKFHSVKLEAEHLMHPRKLAKTFLGAYTLHYHVKKRNPRAERVASLFHRLYPAQAQSIGLAWIEPTIDAGIPEDSARILLVKLLHALSAELEPGHFKEPVARCTPPLCRATSSQPHASPLLFPARARVD